MKAYTLILVPGTFAQDAPWVEDTSAFVDSICGVLGNDVNCVKFPWSGGNSHRERVEASEELSQFIEVTASEQRGRSIVLVCHSHGGNVALYALKDSRIAAFVESVVCMGTPFIYVTPRSVPWYLASIKYIALICILALATLLALLVWPGPPTVWLLATVLSGLALVSSGLFLVAALRISEGLVAKLKARQKKVAATLSYPAHTVQVLEVSIAGDEARHYLGLLGAISQLPSKVQDLILRLASPASIGTLWSITLFSFLLVLRMPSQPDPINISLSVPGGPAQFLQDLGPPGSDERRAELRTRAGRFSIYMKILGAGPPKPTATCIEELVELRPDERWEPPSAECNAFVDSLSAIVAQTRAREEEESMAAAKRRALPWAASAGVFVGILALLAAQLVQLAIFGTAFLLRSHKLGFGESVVDSWLCDISTDRSLLLPEGAVSRCEVYSRDLSFYGRGLRHSLFYRDPAIIERIGDWIRAVPKLRELPLNQFEGLAW